MPDRPTHFCPVCVTERTLRSSAPQGLWERLQRALGKRVFRCTGCGRRVIRRASSPRSKPRATPREREPGELLDLAKLRPAQEAGREQFDHLISEIRRSEQRLEEKPAKSGKQPHQETGQRA